MYTSLNTNIMAANTAKNLNSHYANLATSTQRLSSGLRINSAADDAAGLAIRELMRADVAALNQGVRNVNDAISMLQVADGALAIIDEKLIRMKELAEQAATGTYDSTQRLMIDSEFQAMANEIERIANASDFNGIKLLDGDFLNQDYTISLDGEYIVTQFLQYGWNLYQPEINQLFDWNIEGITEPSLLVGEYNIQIRNNNLIHLNNDLGLLMYGTMVPQSDNFVLEYSATGRLDINGHRTELQNSNGFTWRNGQTIQIDGDYINEKTGEITSVSLDELTSKTINWSYIQSQNGDFIPNGEPIYTTNFGNISVELPDYKRNQHNTLSITLDLNGNTQPGINVIKMDWDIFSNVTNISDHNAIPLINLKLKVIDNTINDSFNPDYLIPNKLVRIHFGTEANGGEDFYDIYKFDATRKGLGIDGLQVKTQDSAQYALTTINNAMIKKDKIRAYFGAMQNRLENTATNLTIQSENLQAAESRISDADIATEMTNFIRNQILTQSAVAMLGQANSMPQMLMRLLQ